MEVLGRETLRERDGGDHSGQKDEQSKQNARGVVHGTSAAVAAMVTIIILIVGTRDHASSSHRPPRLPPGERLTEGVRV